MAAASSSFGATVQFDWRACSDRWRYVITGWMGINENLAKSRREGVDVEMDYGFDLLEGDAVIRFVGTRMLQSREWTFQDFPDEFEEYVDSISAPRWRANLQAKYSRGNWRGSWDVNFVHRNLRVKPSSYESNPGSVRPIRNASYAVHNMQVGYRFAKADVSTYLGIDNVFKGRGLIGSLRPRPFAAVERGCRAGVRFCRKRAWENQTGPVPARHALQHDNELDNQRQTGDWTVSRPRFSGGGLGPDRSGQRLQ